MPIYSDRMVGALTEIERQAELRGLEYAKVSVCNGCAMGHEVVRFTEGRYKGMWGHNPHGIEGECRAFPILGRIAELESQGK